MELAENDNTDTGPESAASAGFEPSHPEPIQQAEPATADPQDKPEGWDQVEFTPAQQKRFDRVYRQLKDHERNINEYRDIASQQASLIEQLRQSQGQVINHIVEDKFTQREAQLQTEQRTAFEAGDLDKYNKATRELGKLDVQREQAALQAKPQPQQVQPQYTANDIVSEAVKTGEITSQDANYYHNWAAERDEFGDFKRPWVQRSTEEALRIGAAVFQSPAFASKPFNEKLNEIDRLMGVQGRAVNQSVMPSGTNLTRPSATSKIKLSPDIERMAVRTKFAGRGKSDVEHIEAYRKQMALARGGK